MRCRSAPAARTAAERAWPMARPNMTKGPARTGPFVMLRSRSRVRPRLSNTAASRACVIMSAGLRTKNDPTIARIDRIAPTRKAERMPASGRPRPRRRSRRASGAGGHDRHEERGARRAGHLLHGADDRGAVRVEARFDRAEGRREQRREHEGETRRQRHVRDEQQPGRGVLGHHRERPEHPAHDDAARHEQPVGPKRSNSRPTVGPRRPIMRPPGSSRRPVIGRRGAARSAGRSAGG